MQLLFYVGETGEGADVDLMGVCMPEMDELEAKHATKHATNYMLEAIKVDAGYVVKGRPHGASYSGLHQC